MPDRLSDAPQWAQDLHDCIHRLERQVREDRHKAANAAMSLGKSLDDLRHQLDTLTKVIGTEGSDGRGGTGLIGRLIRADVNVANLVGERNMVRGVLIALGMSATILFMGLRAWVETIVRGIK